MGRSRVSRLLVVLLLLVSAPASAQVVSELDRREARRHYRDGQEFLSSEQFEKAADAFRRAIEKDPLLALAHYGLGQSYMALRRYASAIVALESCRDAYQKLAALALTENIIADRQRDDEIRELRESIRLFQSSTVKTANPDRTQYLVRFETRLRELEREKQTNIQPERPPAFVYLSLGSAYFRNGEIDAAESAWKTAVDIDPRFGEAHNNLGALYAMARRKLDAAREVEAAERAGFRVHPQLKEDIRRLP